MVKAKAKSKSKAKSAKSASGKNASHGSEPSGTANQSDEIAALKKQVDLLSTAKEKSGNSHRAKYIEHPAIEEDLRRSWREWRRSHVEWSTQEYDNTTMVLGMVRCLSQSQKELVYSKLSPPVTSHTVSDILAILETAYGTISILESAQDVKTYRAHTRENASISEFLIKHEVLRQRAVSSGMTKDESDGFGLITAAKLSAEQESKLLADLDLSRSLSAQIDTAVKGQSAEPVFDGDSHAAPTYTEVEKLLQRFVFQSEFSRLSKDKSVGLVGSVGRDIAKKNGKATKATKSKSKIKREKMKKKIAALSAAATPAPPVLPASQASDWLCCACGNHVFGSKTVCGFNSCTQARTAACKVITGKPKGKGGGKGGGKASNGKSGGKGTGNVSGKGLSHTPSATPCRLFSTSGGCKYGDRCKFSHSN